MILRGQTIVMVPWFDSEGMKQWSRMSFRGEMNRKWMYNKVVKFVKSEFSKTVDRKWIQAHCLVINEFDKNAGGDVFNTEKFNEALEHWIQDMEAEVDANEAESDSVLPNEDTGESTEPLPPVPDSN